MHRFSIILFLVIFLFLNSYILSQWTRINAPYGSFANDLVNFKDSSLVLGTQEGIYISSNWGKDWIKKDIQYTSSSPIVNIKNTLSIFSTIYIATNNTIQKSTNSGENWEIISSGLTGTINYLEYSYVFLQGTTLYAATSNGIFISSDNGSTWIEKTKGISNKTALSVRYFNNVMFAQTKDSIIYKSTDNGANWTISTGVNKSEPAPIIKLSNGRFLLGDLGKIQYSDNNGTNWSFVNLLNNSKVTDFIETGSSVVYAVTDNSTIYKSTNNGTTWSIISLNLTGLPNNSKISINKIKKFGNYFYILYKGCGIYRTTNIEGNWEEINKGISNSITQTITSNHFTNTMYIGTNTNGIHSYNLSTGVSTKIGPLDKLFFPKYICFKYNIFTGKTTVLAGDPYDGIYKTTDNGKNWTKIDQSFGGYLNGMTMNMYGLFQLRGNKIYKTTNDGTDWNTVYTSAGTIYQLLSSKNNSNLYIHEKVANQNKLLLSTNGGIDWINIWNDLFFDSSEIINDIDSKDSLIILATNQSLYISTNNGNNWTEFVNPFFNYKVNTCVYINKDLIFVSNGFGIFYSNDKGGSWSNITDNIPMSQYIYTIHITNSDIYIGSQSTGIWKRPLSSLVSVENDKRQNLSYKLEQNYPNPFNGYTTINFSVPIEADANLVVYDQLGREIIHIKLSETDKANGFYRLNMNAFGSGIYFYKLISSNFTLTKKMVYIK